ncbi:MAG TPA: isocitrate lyase/PEP mutase family protein [Terriglobales bacterium]|nr:isocitrate lyase/PEP mutase family protein [Terriglobales bacterium]
MTRAKRLRELLARAAPVIAPGAHDLMTTKLVARLGFDAVYLGSYGCAASRYGISDQSLVTMTELLEQARLMVEATELPVIADLEEGGGNAVNTHHFTRRFEAAGVAAVHIEDHTPGKLYGRGGALHPIPVAVEKIRAALDARRHEDTVIIARCEALVLGRPVAEAAERCQAYAETGADMILVTALPLADTPAFAKTVGKPMAAFTLDGARDAVRAAGLALAIYPLQGAAVAYRAVKAFLTELRGAGTVSGGGDIRAAMKEIDELVGAEEGAGLAQRYKVV